jgi:hypothetical protein
MCGFWISMVVVSSRVTVSDWWKLCCRKFSTSPSWSCVMTLLVGLRALGTIAIHTRWKLSSHQIRGISYVVISTGATCWGTCSTHQITVWWSVKSPSIYGIWCIILSGWGDVHQVSDKRRWQTHLVGTRQYNYIHYNGNWILLHSCMMLHILEKTCTITWNATGQRYLKWQQKYRQPWHRSQQ